MQQINVTFPYDVQLSHLLCYQNILYYIPKMLGFYYRIIIL